MMQREFTLFWPNGKLRLSFNLNGKTDGQVAYYYPMEIKNSYLNLLTFWFMKMVIRKKIAF